MKRWIVPLFALLLLAPLSAVAAPLPILAAENFYGDVAQQIGGGQVTVTSILSNPDQDPHLFEVSPSVARAVSAARIVVFNGVDYDPWMARMIRATHGVNRVVIDVGALANRKPGDNPHIWYDTAVMLRYAITLANDLAHVDPAHAAGYRQRLVAFRQSMQPVIAKVAALHARLSGVPVTATEPVFGYMLNAIGMRVRNMPFQIAVMNNTEPSASDIAGIETDLKQHRVRLLVYNSQATDSIARRMMQLAHASHVPVIGVTETKPAGLTYQSWMLQELDAVGQALPH